MTWTTSWVHANPATPNEETPTSTTKEPYNNTKEPKY
jgi:hypothetical protein